VTFDAVLPASIADAQFWAGAPEAIAVAFVLVGGALAVLARRRLTLATGFVLASLAAPVAGRAFPPTVGWVFAAAFFAVGTIGAADLLWSGTARRGHRLGPPAPAPAPTWLFVEIAAFAIGLSIWPQVASAVDVAFGDAARAAALTDPARLAFGASVAVASTLIPLLWSRDALRLAVAAGFGILATLLAAVGLGRELPDAVLPAVAGVLMAAAAVGAWQATTPVGDAG